MSDHSISDIKIVCWIFIIWKNFLKEVLFKNNTYMRNYEMNYNNDIFSNIFVILFLHCFCNI